MTDSTILKKIIILFLFIFLLKSWTYPSYKGFALRESKGHTNDITIEIPDLKSFVTGNGIQVFYIEDELPQLAIIVTIGFGKLYENKNNAGISDLLAKTLTLSGSKKYPGASLHQTIESIGGRISIHSTWETTIISLRVIEKHSELAFNILVDLLEHPKLDNEHIKHARSLLLERVRRKNDRPSEIAFEKAREIIFDGDTYGAICSKKSLNSITRNDLLKVWETYFRSKNIIMGISTSINYSKIRDYVKTKFNKLRRGGRRVYAVDSKKISDSMREKSKKIYLIPKDIPQSTIVVGTIAPNISDNRIFSLTLMNYILGGGSFNSRLMKEIRVKRGLAYVVQSVIKFRKKTGVFLAFAQTKTESLDLTLSLLLSNIQIMTEKQVMDDELQWAKESLRNSYIFEFDTYIDLLNKFITLNYNGLTEKYLKDYPNNITKVTNKNIVNSCRDIIGNGLVKVVVGKKEILMKKLKQYGEVILVENPN